jgi:tartrate-resistant acid phosphatase type 5
MSGTRAASSLTRREFIGALGALAIPALADSALAKTEVNLLAVGDWGAPRKTKDPQDAKILLARQDRIAAAMGEYATKSAAAGSVIDAVLALGDNFYADFKQDGLQSAEDSRFSERFEKLYARPALDVPFFFALGNHDYEDGDGKAWKHQIDYAARYAADMPPGRWRFPAKSGATWYRQDFPMGYKPLSVLVLDTNTDHVKGKWKDQIAWLEHDLDATKDSLWRIAVAHHPMFTDGYHWNREKDLYAKIRKTILSRLTGVAFYVSGHDHNQQHISHPDHPQLDFLLSGAGGGDFIKKRQRFDAPYKNTFMPDFGFLHLRFAGQSAIAHFVAVSKQDWEIRHTVTRAQG